MFCCRKKKKGGKPGTAQQGKEAEKKPHAPAGGPIKESTKPGPIKEGAEKAKDKPAGGVAPAPQDAKGLAPALGPDGRPITKQDTEHDPEKKAARAKAGSKDFHDEEKTGQEHLKNPEEEKKREAEKLLQQRFKTFDLHFKDIINLLDSWDRTQGNIFRQPSPSEKSEHEDAAAASNKKNKNAGKNNPKEKEKKNDKADKSDAVGTDKSKNLG